MKLLFKCMGIFIFGLIMFSIGGMLIDGCLEGMRGCVVASGVAAFILTIVTGVAMMFYHAWNDD